MTERDNDENCRDLFLVLGDDDGVGGKAEEAFGKHSALIAVSYASLEAVINSDPTSE